MYTIVQAHWGKQEQAAQSPTSLCGPTRDTGALTHLRPARATGRSREPQQGADSRPRAPIGLLVRGRRLSPQVEFSAVRLDLAPHGSQAECQHGQDDQLLHCVLPLSVLTISQVRKPSKWASSPFALDAPGVPYRLGRLVHFARLAEHEEPVE
jgi:hypothetical protein